MVIGLMWVIGTGILLMGLDYLKANAHALLLRRLFNICLGITSVFRYLVMFEVPSQHYRRLYLPKEFLSLVLDAKTKPTLASAPVF